jgi:hypothetical protein
VNSARYALLGSLASLGAVVVLAFAATWLSLDNADSTIVAILWAATVIAGLVSVVAGTRKVERIVEESIRINVPRERLFPFIGDPRNDSHWIPRIASVEQLTVGPIQNGTRFRQNLLVAGRKRSIESEITFYDPPTTLDSRLVGRGDVTSGYRLQGPGDATDLTVHTRFRIGVGLALVLGPVSRQQLRTSLVRLKAYAEANLGSI